MDSTWQNLIDLNKSYLHLNPALPSLLKDLFQNTIHSQSQNLQKNHVWILSSGTSSQISYKLIALNHEAFLSSAKAVNNHLQANSSDVWLNVLPLFHVGGLSILYRSYLQNSSCVNLWNPDFKWNPFLFKQILESTKASLTSLVPTQVYDLVKEKIYPTSSLRAILVGGARLNEDLYIKARKMGWPLLPSFGMTEAASQIATASLDTLNSSDLNSPSYSQSESYPRFKMLDHIETKVNPSQILSIKGPSLLEGYFHITSDSEPLWINPLDENGWFLTQDRAEIFNPYLSVLSRVDELVKIKGELVNLAELRTKLESLCSQNDFNFECTIVALPDSRDGFKLVLVGEISSERLSELFSLFNMNALPYERLFQCFSKTKLPRNNLGKILYNQLSETLTNELCSSEQKPTTY